MIEKRKDVQAIALLTCCIAAQYFELNRKGQKYDRRKINLGVV